MSLVNGRYQHFIGFSRICANFTTSPAQPGASFSATASGPAVLSGTQTGTLDAGGMAQASFDIGLFGTYTINGSVTAGTGTAMASTTVNVTAAPGQGC